MIRLEFEVNKKHILKTAMNMFQTIDEKILKHSLSTGYFAALMAQEDGYDKRIIDDILQIGLFQSAGYYSNDKVETPDDLLKLNQNYKKLINGFLRINYTSNFERNAEKILYLNVPYNYGEAYTLNGKPVKVESYYVKIASLIDIYLRSEDVNIIDKIKSLSGKFIPEDIVNRAVKMLQNNKFEILALEEIKSKYLSLILNEKLRSDSLKKSFEFFAYTLDFTSEQTSTHSFDVYYITEKLAKLFNLDKKDVYFLELSALIHDVGKLALDINILEKPGKLTDDEFNHVRNHVGFTYEIFKDCGELAKKLHPAYNHHERIDGSGYLRGLDSKTLDIKDYILQVADIFGALVQKRAYKDVFEKSKVIGIFEEEIKRNKLHKEVVSKAIENYDSIITFIILNRVKHLNIHEQVSIRRENLIKLFNEKYN